MKTFKKVLKYPLTFVKSLIAIEYEIQKDARGMSRYGSSVRKR